MIKAIANLPNWHRYVISALGVVLVVATAIVKDPALVPPDLHGLVVYAPLAIVLAGAVLGALPRFQLPTGAGAPPIVSPPPKDGPTFTFRDPPSGPSASAQASAPVVPPGQLDAHAVYKPFLTRP